MILSPIEQIIKNESKIKDADIFLLDNMKLKYAKAIKAGTMPIEVTEKATSVHIAINKLKSQIEDYFETLQLLNQNS